MGLNSRMRTVPLNTTDARLQLYVQRIWQGGDEASPIAVTLGPPPDGHIIAEEYAVLPHPRRVRFLVPMGPRATTVASFRSYNASRAPVSRALRAALASGYAHGAADRLFPHRLTVSVDHRYPLNRWAEVLVMRHLAGVLGHDDLLAFTAVRRVNANAKPTLQLFDSRGGAVGYAKLGTTPATRRMVRTEAAAMADLSGRLDSVFVPPLLGAGDWGDLAYSIGGPLPADVRRWTAGADTTVPAMTQIATFKGLTRGPLQTSSYAARLRAELEAVRAAGGEQEVASALIKWLDRLNREPAPLAYGRMHGDWISDNLGKSGSGMAVWDWEHSASDAPVGFDYLHWHFHHRLAEKGLMAAVAALDESMFRLSLLGVSPDARELVADLYLLDAFTRRLRLAIGGGGWNERWYPGLLDVIGARRPFT